MHSWLLVGGVAVLVGGLAFGEIRRFERDAAAEIATTLQGDAKAVQIQTAFEEPFGIFSGTLRKATITASNFSVDGLPLFVEPERSKRGKLKLLQLRLNEFTLKKLRVQELRADITNCRYDFSLALKQRKVRLSSAGSGPGYAKLRAGDLANFIMAKYPELTNVTVKLEKYKAFVEGDGDFSIFKAHFYVIAELSPTTNQFAIQLDKAIVFLGDKRVRDGSERALLEAINPVLDLNEDLGLASALKLERIEIRNSYLEVFGTATVPIKPATEPVSPFAGRAQPQCVQFLQQTQATFAPFQSAPLAQSRETAAFANALRRRVRASAP